MLYRDWNTLLCFFFSSRRRHTRCGRDWSSDVCSSDLSLASSSRMPFLATIPTTMMRPMNDDTLSVVRVMSSAKSTPEVDRIADARMATGGDRKSVVWGKSVDLGGRRIIKKKKEENGTE